MRKTKIFYGNQFIGKMNVTGQKETFTKRWTRRIKKSIIIAGIGQATIWAGIGLYQAGKLDAPVIVKAQEVIKEIPVTPDFPPILKKICTAESGWKQFNKNGDVIRNKITPSDIGICQLHETIWNDTARKLGYDIYTEEGNKNMAVWIFNHYGSDPWNSSKQIVNGWGK